MIQRIQVRADQIQLYDKWSRYIVLGVGPVGREKTKWWQRTPEPKIWLHMVGMQEWADFIYLGTPYHSQDVEWPVGNLTEVTRGDDYANYKRCLHIKSGCGCGVK